MSEIILSVDARGKKKKKRRAAGSGSGPTCSSLGLDCSETCCLIDICAETKLDCATRFKRPFSELYIGFASIFGIVLSLSLIVCFVNFCLMYKFCQHYDESVDTYVGGFSICDVVSCLLTCGLMYRKKKELVGPTAEDLDFRRRFEKSMDRHNNDLGFGDAKKKRRV